MAKKSITRRCKEIESRFKGTESDCVSPRRRRPGQHKGTPAPERAPVSLSTSYTGGPGNASCPLEWQKNRQKTKWGPCWYTMKLKGRGHSSYTGSFSQVVLPAHVSILLPPLMPHLSSVWLCMSLGTGDTCSHLDPSRDRQPEAAAFLLTRSPALRGRAPQSSVPKCQLPVHRHDFIKRNDSLTKRDFNQVWVFFVVVFLKDWCSTVFETIDILWGWLKLWVQYKKYSHKSKCLHPILWNSQMSKPTCRWHSSRFNNVKAIYGKWNLQILYRGKRESVA